MKNFAITGVAGYIAPRHLQAIKDTNNNLIAAIDPHDSVGIIDQFFPDCAYFREFERFDRYIEKLHRDKSDKIDLNYLSICSPNYLHDAHIRFALRVGANAICEKPLVLRSENCDMLQEIEEESAGRVYTVLQLREHQSVIELRTKIQQQKAAKKHEVSLTYIISRGAWYLYSWKGDVEKSGGLASNIGIHFFDMLIWIFGDVEKISVSQNTPTSLCGTLEMEKARVTWRLSIDAKDLPECAKKEGKSTYRSIKVDGEEFEFSGGFTDLHTRVYESILAGRGYGIADTKPAIQLVQALKNY